MARLVGSEIGGYRVVRPLGKGAMASVWLAVHAKLENEVALKLLAPQLAGDEDHRRRFTREAKLAARLDHPNIVRVLNAGIDGEHCFIAMELVVGDTLSSKLGVLPLKDVLRIGAQTAQALGAAHERDVIHRDVKPGNMMIERETGSVKVSDFGLALVDTGGGARSMADSIIGSPAYMSPEQARNRTLTSATDVFSLGSSLYALVAGESPYARDEPLATLMALLNDPRPPLSERAPRAPKALLTLVEQMMLDEPELRPSMREVAASLEAIAAGGDLTFMPRSRARAAASDTSPTLPPPATSRGRRPRSDTAPAAPNRKGDAKAKVQASGRRGKRGKRIPQPRAKQPTAPQPAPVAPQHGDQTVPLPNRTQLIDADSGISEKALRSRAPRSGGGNGEIGGPWLAIGGAALIGVGIWLVFTLVKRPDEDRPTPVASATTSSRKQPTLSKGPRVDVHSKLDFVKQHVERYIGKASYMEAWRLLREIDAQSTKDWQPEDARTARLLYQDLEARLIAPVITPLHDWQRRLEYAETEADYRRLRKSLESIKDGSLPPVVREKARLLGQLEARAWKRELLEIQALLARNELPEALARYLELTEPYRRETVKGKPVSTRQDDDPDPPKVRPVSGDPLISDLELMSVIELAYRRNLVTRAGREQALPVKLKDGRQVAVYFRRSAATRSTVAVIHGKQGAIPFDRFVPRVMISPGERVQWALEVLGKEPDRARRLVGAGIYLMHGDSSEQSAADHLEWGRQLAEAEGDHPALLAYDRAIKRWPKLARLADRSKPVPPDHRRFNSRRTHKDPPEEVPQPEDEDPLDPPDEAPEAPDEAREMVPERE